jgi:hypothetical protein
MLALLLSCPAVQAQTQSRSFTADTGVAGTGWDDMDQKRTSDVTMTQKNDPKYFYVPPPDNTHTSKTAQSSWQNNFRNGVLTTVTSMPGSGLETSATPTIEKSVPVWIPGPQGTPVMATDASGNIIYQTTYVPATNPLTGKRETYGVYQAPGNFAARQWGGGVLWPTVLDSIVAESGYNDMVFGDESEQGPPPYSDFEYLETGVSATTGHPSDAPSAWGWPN